MVRAIVSVAVSLGLLCSSSAYAQDDSVAWAPMELYGCTFVDGATMDELDDVIQTWNAWMDENEISDYTAVKLVPHFTAADFPFDVLWLGAWADSAALGGTQQWLEEGGAVQSDFAEVIDCPLHQGMAITNIQEPAGREALAPAEFRNCTLRDGRTVSEAQDAHRAYVDYLAENGSESGHWILRPGPGEDPEADYTVKWVTGFPSWDAVAHDFDLFYNAGGDQRFQDTVGRVMTCDAPRFYNTEVLREAAGEQGPN